ncbi:MAG: thiamine-phosphate kinase [Actinomycetota bacterium]
MKEHEATVSELGERALIERIAARIGDAAADETWAGDETAADETWAGDDAAVIVAPGKQVLFTTDVMIEGVDFDRAYSSGGDIGWKALTVNVSDIAAMAGRPTHAVVTLSLRPDCEVAFVDGILDGLLEASRRWRVRLVGGDLSGADQIGISAAVLGAPAGERAVHRSGAGPGEALCVTGRLGGAAGGLIVLRRRLDRADDSIERLARRHLRPEARVDAGAALAAAGATAMIDLSDGLAVDLGHLCRSSGVGCWIDPLAIPVDESLPALQEDALRLAIAGGEDFELLVALPHESVVAAATAVEATGVLLTRIGEVTDEGCWIGNDPLDRWEEQGWEHLRDR